MTIARNAKDLSVRSPAKLLKASSLIAVLFTVVGGLIFLSNAKRLTSAIIWVEHTGEVLEYIHQSSLLTEQVEGGARLYALNHDAAVARRVEQEARALQDIASKVAILVSDSALQTEGAARLSTCSAGLAKDFDTSIPDIAASYRTIDDCKRILGRLAAQEHTLLVLRKEETSHGTTAIFMTAVAFALLSIFAMCVLFILLMREILRHSQLVVNAADANQALRQSFQALENNIDESAILSTYRDELQLCVELPQVYASAGQVLTKLLPGCRGTLSIINSSRNLLEEVIRWGDVDQVDGAIVLFSPVSCCGLRSGKPRWRHKGETQVECTHFEGAPPSRYLCVPMSAQGETLGVLHIVCEDQLVYLALQERLSGMHQAVQLTGTSIAAIGLRVKLEQQSIRDPLTSLFNRHFLELTLNREILRAQRRKTGLAVFMLDIDHFKTFNDRFGHAAGDKMLQGVAKLFQANVRGDDTICRYGGEEFLIILPDIEPEIAFRRAEIIRSAVENAATPLANGAVGRATLSIGVSFYPTDGESMETLLSKADEALYRSKGDGRNRVSLPYHLPTAG